MTRPRAQVVPARDILRIVLGAVEFPFPTVCKHLVAAQLLQVMEENGAVIPDGIADAIVRAEDHVSRPMLARWLAELDEADGRTGL